jgi:hypothetical protein
MKTEEDEKEDKTSLKIVHRKCLVVDLIKLLVSS